MSKLVLVDGAKGHTGTYLIKEILETKPEWNIVATDLPLNRRDEFDNWINGVDAVVAAVGD